MKHTKKAKPLNINKTRDIYTGERSPYNDWLAERSEDHGPESAEADATQLPESKGLYYVPKFESELLDFIVNMWDEFTPKQQEVLQMVGYEGKTMEHCASILNITKSAVQSHIENVRKKIEKAIQKQSFSSIK